MVGDRGSHRLHDVVDRVQTRFDDRFAQGFESRDVQRDVVVDNEDRLRAMVARIANIGDHAIERVGMEISASHFNDRTEAAIESAAAGRLHDVHLTPDHCVAG